jgi:tRNA nucleotidyltransferase (CCA-adding enzyme)
MNCSAVFKFANLQVDVGCFSNPSETPPKFHTASTDYLFRDLTINSLFYNLQQDTIEDFSEAGLVDLKHHLLRTTTTASKKLSADPLCIFRMVRFAYANGFGIHKEIDEAAVQVAKLFSAVSRGALNSC